MDTLNKLKYLFDSRTKRRIAVILILIILGSGAELLGVAMILPVVNLAMDVNYAENFICRIIMAVTGFETREQVMLVTVAFTIAVYILKNIYLSWMYGQLYRFSAVTKKQMATKLMEAYLKQPYAYFLKKNTSELIRSVNTDTAQLYEIVLNCLLVVSNGLTALSLMITLIVVNPVMTLVVAFLLFLCAVLVILGVQKKTRFYGRKNQELSGFLIKYLQQTFEGVKEIKILNNETFFINQYQNTYAEQTEISRKYSMVNLIPKYLIEAVCITGIMGYLAFNIVYNPNYVEIIPQLAIFCGAAYKLLPSVNALYAYLNTIIYHRASIDLIYHDVKEAEELNGLSGDSDGRTEAIKFRDKITVSGVAFQYEGTDKVVLSDVNFEIPKGKSLALIGPSGGGKTTMADILLGLLSPVRGAVLADGRDINENIRAWRRKIGYIPQMIYLTDGSIRSNIALGVPREEIDDERVWEALAEAQLKTFVESLEQGLDTEVGERGVRISGGQRQRIGIARALYRDPEILVFDEATSALDNETEKEVMKAIEGLHGNKTMLMIAHRLSTIEHCDMVYKVENGGVERVK